MKKENLFTIVAAIIAIIFALLYFMKNPSSNNLTADQLKKVGEILKNNPGLINNYNAFGVQKPVPDSEKPKAFVLVKSFRKSSYNKRKWITCTIDEMYKFLADFEVNTGSFSLPKDTRWDIGFYPFWKKDPTNPRDSILDFYTIPNLVDTSKNTKIHYDMFDRSKKGKDYFDIAQKVMYDYSDPHAIDSIP